MDFLGAEPAVNEPPSRVEGAMMVANQWTKIEIDFQELGLQESKLILNTPLQSFLGSSIEAWKKSLQDHVWFDHNFRLLRRHFQLQLWVNHRREWISVDFDSSVRESLNLNQVGLRNDQYWFKMVLNEGQSTETCGRP